MNTSPGDSGCPLGLPLPAALGNHGQAPEASQELTCVALDLLPGDLILAVKDAGDQSIGADVGPWLLLSYVSKPTLVRGGTTEILNEMGEHTYWFVELTDIYTILRSA